VPAPSYYRSIGSNITHVNVEILSCTIADDEVCSIVRKCGLTGHDLIGCDVLQRTQSSSGPPHAVDQQVAPKAVQSRVETHSDPNDHYIRIEDPGR